MKKRLLICLGLVGVFFLLPEVARADNCSFFADCFNTAKAATAAATAMGIIAAIVSAAADLTPVVGEIKAGTQLITGRDPITNKEVPRWESAIGLIPVFGRVAARGLRYGMAASRAGRAMQTARALRTTAKGLGEGIDVYETVRQPYDIAKTIRDTAQDITGQIHDYRGAPSSNPSRHSGATRESGSTDDSNASHVHELHALPFDKFAHMLTRGFYAVPDDAPASVAAEMLASLAKAFGKDSEVLKHIAKAKDKLGDLPKDATMKTVVTKLKG